MILEGLVTTTAADGRLHLAPMGPTVDAGMTHLLLRPFPSSTTFQNLVRHGEGVFHVTDDALLIAKACLGQAGEPPSRPAERVKGYLLSESCRAYEFVVRSIDTTRERMHVAVDVVATHALREFVGFHRAKHAVVEAAIVATRFGMLPAADVEGEFERCRVIVAKTGGPAEREAMAFLDAAWAEHRGVPCE